MYTIKTNRENFTILGKLIPNKPEKLEDLTIYFNKPVYNGKKQTHESLLNLLSEKEKWGYVQFEKVEAPTESEKKINITTMSNDNLVKLAKERDIKLTGKEDRKHLLSILKD